MSFRLSPTIVLILFLLSFRAFGENGLVAQELSVVPPVESMKLTRGAEPFSLLPGWTLTCPDEPLWNEHMGNFSVLADRLYHESRMIMKPNSLVVAKDETLAAEQYKISITSDEIQVRVSSIKGLAHATATLLQIIGQVEPASGAKSLPALTIDDQPSFGYRSFMVDLGRNPHSFDLLKQTVDLLWFYKVDSLHLHLTDDQLWSFPSKAYPKLQSERAEITWEQFAELERYAAIRGVTLIPELEVPGHSSLLRREYPEVFGKTPTELTQSDTALAGIKTLLDEMIELFPSSPYIHIGGDEAYGVPVELQRALINKLHAHLKSRGKKTLVWEGPSRGSGDNEVNSEVIHLNWRTIEYPAREMVEAGHPVVNAAWDPLYLVDHYPRNNFTMASPAYIYKNLNPLRFKHFNPGIRTFAKPETLPDSKNVIGFCMPWWEGREQNYWPMVVPRLIAMSDAAWNVNQVRDVDMFQQRMETSEAVRRLAYHPVQIKATGLAVPEDGVFHRSTAVSLDIADDLWPNSNEGVWDHQIRFTLDGSEPTEASTLYEKPFELKATTTVRAALFEEITDLKSDSLMSLSKAGHDSQTKFVCVEPTTNLALGKPVTSSATSGAPFSIGRITDGGIGNLDYYLGYPAEPEPIRITIDLEEPTEASRVVVHHFHNNGPYESYSVEVSADGQLFEQVADRTAKPETPSANAVHKFEKQEIRYVRIVTHGCKGNVFDSFSRITEVQVFAD